MKKTTSPLKKLPLLLIPVVISIIVVVLLLKRSDAPLPEAAPEAALKAAGASEPQASVISQDLLDQSTFPPPNATECGACHALQLQSWIGSQHANAHRLVDPKLDDISFKGKRILDHALHKTEVGTDEHGAYYIKTKNRDMQEVKLKPEAVLAIEPLRQYLFPFPDGRLQMLDMAWDTSKEEWFNVYGHQNRELHEWGSWLGRGMNWNTQCAYCHNTNFVRGYDIKTDSYHSTWDNMGISCNQCHGNLDGHAKTPDAPLETITPLQAMHACATCHTRREQMLEGFKPGDNFFDYFRPSLPHEERTYYQDGQVLDEDFEFGSFQTSRLFHKGVTCLDCHDPHSAKTKLPIENNALCMSCHTAPGRMDARPIDPVSHGNHAEGSVGNSCVGCHMPETTYMERDPRRDHGFISPDPLLTKEMGIPNACNRCHDDQDADWALEWTNTWYGEEKLEGKRTRQRARVVKRAQDREDSVVPALKKMIETEEITAWRASLIHLCEPWSYRPDVQQFLLQYKGDEDPLVRTAVVDVLARIPEIQPQLTDALNDPVRMVRITAATTMQNTLAEDTPSIVELQKYINFISDQPSGAMQQAQLAVGHNRLDDALEWVSKADTWDPNNAYILHMKGRIQHSAGKSQEAVESMKKAMEREPTNPEYPYSLGLLYGELGQPEETLKMLKAAVKAEPQFSRAWYNLGLAYAQKEELKAAVDSLKKAEALDPQNPGIPYARATIHMRQNNHQAAREATLKALHIQPNNPQAQQLMYQLQQNADLPSPAPRN